MSLCFKPILPRNMSAIIFKKFCDLGESRPIALVFLLLWMAGRSDGSVVAGTVIQEVLTLNGESTYLTTYKDGTNYRQDGKKIGEETIGIMTNDLSLNCRKRAAEVGTCTKMTKNEMINSLNNATKITAGSDKSALDFKFYRVVDLHKKMKVAGRNCQLFKRSYQTKSVVKDAVVFLYTVEEDACIDATLPQTTTNPEIKIDLIQPALSSNPKYLKIMKQEEEKAKGTALFTKTRSTSQTILGGRVIVGGENAVKELTVRKFISLKNQNIPRDYFTVPAGYLIQKNPNQQPRP